MSLGTHKNSDTLHAPPKLQGVAEQNLMPQRVQSTTADAPKWNLSNEHRGASQVINTVGEQRLQNADAGCNAECRPTLLSLKKKKSVLQRHCFRQCNSNMPRQHCTGRTSRHHEQGPQTRSSWTPAISETAPRRAHASVTGNATYTEQRSPIHATSGMSQLEFRQLAFGSEKLRRHSITLLQGLKTKLCIAAPCPCRPVYNPR